MDNYLNSQISLLKPIVVTHPSLISKPLITPLPPSAYRRNLMQSLYLEGIRWGEYEFGDGGIGDRG